MPVTDISSLSNELVKHCVKLREDAAYRNAHKRIVIHGEKVYKELTKLSKFPSISTFIDLPKINRRTVFFTPKYEKKIEIEKDICCIQDDTAT
jgi:hypothetical protein